MRTKIEYTINNKSKLVEKLILFEDKNNSQFNTESYYTWKKLAEECSNSGDISMFANGYKESLDNNYSRAEKKLLNLVQTANLDYTLDDIQLYITPKGNINIRTKDDKDIMTVNRFSDDMIDELRLQGYFDSYDSLDLGESLNGSKNESLTEDIYEDDDGDYDDEFEKGRDGCYYKYIRSKSVYDSDGFTTDYTLYMKAEPVEDRFDVSFVTVFGDSDIYRPDDGNYDYETDDLDNAIEWFDSYNGFEDDEFDESYKEEINNMKVKSLKEASRLIESYLNEDSDSNRKNKFIKLYYDRFGENPVAVEQHHIDGNHNNNPLDLSNQAYFVGNDKDLLHKIHMFLHAKSKLDYLSKYLRAAQSTGVYIVRDGKVVGTSFQNLVDELYKNEDVDFKFIWNEPGSTNESFSQDKNLSEALWNEYRIDFIDTENGHKYSEEYQAWDCKEAIQLFRADYPQSEGYKFIKIYKLTDEGYEEIRSLDESLNEKFIPDTAKILDSGYCDKDEWNKVKKEQIEKYSKKYSNVKCELTKSDTPRLRMWLTYYIPVDESLKLKEDYQHKDDDWGKPYTYEEVEDELRNFTNNWTEKEGILRTPWEQEKDYGVLILKKHYDNVEVSDGRTGSGEDMSWAVSYSSLKK